LINFCERINTESIEALSVSIEVMKQLKFLTLDFSWCKTVSLEAFAKLFISLETLTELTYLNLKLNYCQVNDRIAIHFEDKLKNELKDVERAIVNVENTDVELFLRTKL